jgi:hypothetical protein
MQRHFEVLGRLEDWSSCAAEYIEEGSSSVFCQGCTKGHHHHRHTTKASVLRPFPGRSSFGGSEGVSAMETGHPSRLLHHRVSAAIVVFW